jgi:hypothetical protein
MQQGEAGEFAEELAVGPGEDAVGPGEDAGGPGEDAGGPEEGAGGPEPADYLEEPADGAEEPADYLADPADGAEEPADYLGEPEPAGHRPSTGEPRVDAALARLDDLAGRPVTEHRAVFEDVHRRLRDVLGELDSRQPPGLDATDAAGGPER